MVAACLLMMKEMPRSFNTLSPSGPRGSAPQAASAGEEAPPTLRSPVTGSSQTHSFGKNSVRWFYLQGLTVPATSSREARQAGIQALGAESA